MADNQSAEDPVALSVRLTPEELVVLYEESIDRSAAIPYSDLLPDYSESERELATDVARRSLIARQLLQSDGNGGLAPHPMALAIVGCTVLAKGMITVFAQLDNGEIRSVDFHHYRDEVYLAHSESQDGYHAFDLYVDEATFHQAILGSLQFEASPDLSCPPGELSGEQLERIVDLARERDSKAVLAALKESSLEKETINELAKSLKGPFVIKTISLLNGEDDESPGERELVFLQGDNGLWNLETASAGEDLVSLKPISVTDSHEKVQNLIADG